MYLRATWRVVALVAGSLALLAAAPVAGSADEAVRISAPAALPNRGASAPELAVNRSGVAVVSYQAGRRVAGERWATRVMVATRSDARSG